MDLGFGDSGSPEERAAIDMVVDVVQQVAPINILNAPTIPAATLADAALSDLGLSHNALTRIGVELEHRHPALSEDSFFADLKDKPYLTLRQLVKRVYSSAQGSLVSPKTNKAEKKKFGFGSVWKSLDGRSHHPARLELSSARIRKHVCGSVQHSQMYPH